ncbi:MAG: glycine-rich protein [Candidatus Cybelea sp.]
MTHDAQALALHFDCGEFDYSDPLRSGAMPQTPLTTHGKTFSYTGAKQTFVVPRDVTHITVVARGAGGASCPRTGRGARIYAVIPVAAKERLDIFVGGSGGTPGGGFNGGGSSYGLGYGGEGGASDVRVRPGRLRDRILVAAGGGGKGAPTITAPTIRFMELERAVADSPVIMATPVFRSGLERWAGAALEGTQTQGGAGGSGGSGSFCYAPGNPGTDGALGVGGRAGNGIYSGSYYGGPGETAVEATSGAARRRSLRQWLRR